MVRKNVARTLTFAVAALVAAVPPLLMAQAQMPQPRLTPNSGQNTQPPAAPTNRLMGKTLNYKCNLGSFKLLPKSTLASGHIEMAFTGTLLLSRFDGNISVSGNLKKEYTGYGRQVYFGTGKVVLDGKFRGIQWFGSALTGKWTGDGVARLYGEFDQKLETGKYWYDNPKDVKDWGTYGLTAEVPERFYGQADANVIPRKRGG